MNQILTAVKYFAGTPAFALKKVEEEFLIVNYFL
jgi:hypothetical protein